MGFKTIRTIYLFLLLAVSATAFFYAPPALPNVNDCGPPDIMIYRALSQDGMAYTGTGITSGYNVVQLYTRKDGDFYLLGIASDYSQACKILIGREFMWAWAQDI